MSKNRYGPYYGPYKDRAVHDKLTGRVYVAPKLTPVLNKLDRRVKELETERDRLREALEDARRTLDVAQEINPSNYDHDQVWEMNCAYCAAYAIIEAALQEGGDE